jgi:KipI family sensor histidine kinase inhibitor
VLPYGDRAALIELDEPGQVLAVAERLRDLPGGIEIVPAARTVLITFDPLRFDRTLLGARLAGPTPERSHAAERTVEIEVRYDGADLELIAQTAGCSAEDVMTRHTDATYTVAFCGFSPGFAYLTGLHPSLRQPRLDTPRTSVSAGSVGIAGEFTGAYPRSSPGGWRLLGRTEATLWDVARDEPALLTPGTRVRFTAT